MPARTVSVSDVVELDAFPLMEGLLEVSDERESAVLWRRRWVRVQRQRIAVHKAEVDELNDGPIYAIKMASILRVKSENQLVFFVEAMPGPVGTATYFFRAESSEARDAWMGAVQEQQRRLLPLAVSHHRDAPRGSPSRSPAMRRGGGLRHFGAGAPPQMHVVISGRATPDSSQTSSLPPSQLGPRRPADGGAGPGPGPGRGKGGAQTGEGKGRGDRKSVV